MIEVSMNRSFRTRTPGRERRADPTRVDPIHRGRCVLRASRYDVNAALRP
jgi:hypothetical protein